MAKRKRYLFVCTNRRPDGDSRGSCAARGALEVHAALKEKLKSEGLAALEARPCACSCLDACWAGPVIAVTPDQYFYGNVKLSDVDEIVEALKHDQIVERLVMSPGQFLEPKVLRALPEEEQKALSEPEIPRAPK